MDEVDGRRCYVRDFFDPSHAMFDCHDHYRFLETVHTAILLKKLYFYSVSAIAEPANLGTVDW